MSQPEFICRGQEALSDLHQFGNEKRQTNSDRCHKVSAMSLSRQHKDGEDQLNGQEHLNEQALYNGGGPTKGGGDFETGRLEAIYYGGSCDPT